MNTIEKFASIRKDLANLLNVLDDIRKVLDSADHEIKIAGKTLRSANLEQAPMHAYYDEIRVHLNTTSKYFEIKIAEHRAKVLRMIAEESRLSYGERMMAQLAEEDTTLINLQMSKLEVDEVLGLATSKCLAMKQRGYSLKNITELMVAQVQDEHMILN